MKRITASIEAAPLKVKPIQTPSHIRAYLSGASNYQLRRSSTSSDSSAPRQFQSNLTSAITKNVEGKKQNPTVALALDESNFDSLVKNLSETLQMNQTPTSGMLSTSNSADLLSISPIFGKPFDTQSLDDSLITPADDDLIRGIRNINYDIDFSDSPENSLAEEIAEIRKYSNIVGESSSSGIAMSKSDLEEFDPLSSDKKVEAYIDEKNLTRSLIDESPNGDLLLENPLQPTKNDYRGFSSQTSKILSITCETGNTSSQSNNPK